MKKLLIMAAMVAIAAGCCSDKVVVDITNQTGEARLEEMISVSFEAIRSGLDLEDDDQFIAKDQDGTEIPYQITYDNQVIMPIKLDAGACTSIVFKKGKPSSIFTLACGRLYPERMDDIAWENDLVAFRTYGPTVQKKGEKAFGYDLFAKRGTSEPVLPEMYRRVTDPELKAKVKELKKTDPEASKRIQDYRSYHVDKGFGMDCYAVGPTLGAGTAALVHDGEILYPWCYKEYEILDNGPLRFTVRLTFTPVEMDGKEIVETRVITLDAGSHLNKTTVTYSGIDKVQPIVSGIVLHDESGRITMNPEEKFMSYVDPTTKAGQGELYLGIVLPSVPEKMETVYFSKEESMLRNKALGHVLSYSGYEPAEGYTYWWGFGWDRADMSNIDNWNQYLKAFARQNGQKLTVRIN